METIWFYAQLGFNHVLDFQGLDHFYFIIALAIPYGFNELKKLIWWVSLFTLGHTLSLFGNYFLELKFSADWIEFLIPVTIALSCIPIISAKTFQLKSWFPSLITLVFGLIHGLGFGRYFSLIVASEDEAILDLFSFALGVEAIQICLVIGVLILNLIVSRFLTMDKFKWEIVVGAMIFSQAISMMIDTSPY